MKYLISALLVGVVASAKQHSIPMFNGLDSCLAWPAKKTAKLLLKIEGSGEQFEFTNANGVITLRNKKSHVPYAVFFETSKLCISSDNVKRP